MKKTTNGSLVYIISFRVNASALTYTEELKLIFKNSDLLTLKHFKSFLQECEVGPGQVYQSGEDFILGCSSCKCGGPFISCKPLCPLEQCPLGSETVYENREVAGTDCICESK